MCCRCLRQWLWPVRGRALLARVFAAAQQRWAVAGHQHAAAGSVHGENSLCLCCNLQRRSNEILKKCLSRWQAGVCPESGTPCLLRLMPVPYYFAVMVYRLFACHRHDAMAVMTGSTPKEVDQ
jgi:hypothetical protein